MSLLHIFPSSLLEKYDEITKIMDGSHSVVFSAIEKKTGTKYAIKHIKQRNKSFAQKEAAFLKRFNHPHILKIIDNFETKDQGCFMIFPFYEQSLFEYIVDSGMIDESVMATILYQILCGLLYLHEGMWTNEYHSILTSSPSLPSSLPSSSLLLPQTRIVHRDLKPENILIGSVPKKKHGFLSLCCSGIGCCRKGGGGGGGGGGGSGCCDETTNYLNNNTNNNTTNNTNNNTTNNTNNNTNNNNTNVDVVIADFDLSTEMNPQRQLNVACGSLLYSAPEVLKRNYNEKCDVWSLGVIMFAMVQGETPYKEIDIQFDDDIYMKKPIKNMYNLRLWSNYHPLAFDFVQRMLCVDPQQRWSVAELLQHEWIKKYRFQ